MPESNATTRFVLMHTSHAGNVGAAARAIKVMGFGDMVLVQPRFADVLSRDETVAMASGATDVLANARIVDSLEPAPAGHATCLCHGDDTARLRAADPGAARALRGPARQRAVGRVRVRWRTIRLEQRCCLSLPHLPEHSHRCSYGSLNLAQAVQIVAYEWRMALGGFAVEPRTRQYALADAPAVQGVLEHWQEALAQLGFLDPSAPKKLMPRLQQLLNRAALTQEEVHILRGIARAVQKRRH